MGWGDLDILCILYVARGQKPTAPDALHCCCPLQVCFAEEVLFAPLSLLARALE